jgi:hypothetical protein
VMDIGLYNSTCNEIINSVPLFYTPMWLDVVHGQGQWQGYVLTIDNEVKAIFPVCVKYKYGFKAIIMPPLTPYLSMWMVNQKDYGSYNAYLTVFLARLPRTILNSLSAYFIYDLKEAWLKSSYELSEKNTYIFANQKYEDIVKYYSPTIKRGINRNAKKIEITEQVSVDDLYTMIEHTFAVKGKKAPVSRNLLVSIKNNFPLHSAILSASYEGNIVASIMVVNDAKCSYYLLSGRSKDAPNGAVTSLIDCAIKKAMDQGRNFDFEGSSIESIAMFFKSFGAQHYKYIHAIKYANKWIKWIAKKNGSQ